MVKIKGIFLWLVISAFLISSGPQKNLDIVYLTYTQDPSKSITVQWHGPASQKQSVVSYRKRGDSEWQQSSGSSIKPDKFNLLIHKVHLLSLSSNTFYEFKIGNAKETHLFRTLPSSLSESPLQFVVAGDAYRSLASFRKTNRQIGKKDPDFVVVGGDIAYTYSNKVPFKGKEWEIKRWMTFFSEWRSSIVGKGGRMIPILPVVGNHDVPKPLVNPNKTSVLLYQLFAFTEDNLSYRAIDVGSYLSLILLDTNHTYPIQGTQTDWLKGALKERAAVPYKFAVYHVGAFPSVYDYNAKIPTSVRNLWCPLFEDSGVQVAFENHNHAFKRTFPIKQGKIDASGVTYIGDGCWGVKPRKTVSKAWYLDKKLKKNCFSFVSLSEQGCDIVSYANTGEVIDIAPHFTAEPSEAAH